MSNKPQVRLHLSDVGPDRTTYGLVGGADVGTAVTARNKMLADDVAAALRRHGYTGAMLVLDGEESLVRADADPLATPDEAIGKILDYVESAERKHFEECSKRERRDHIMLAVQEVRRWYGNYANPVYGLIPAPERAN